MIILFIAACLILFAGLTLLYFMNRQRKRFGVLAKQRVYQDTEEKPGKLLRAMTINVIGKPDYIIRENNMFIPVEVKPLSKTPHSPYPNHTMQLMAYCFLVEEHYGIRPNRGILRYRDKEFTLQYTDEAKASVVNVVKDITRCKTTRKELHCTHPNHNFK